MMLLSSVGNAQAILRSLSLNIRIKINVGIKWPEMVFPPINLYSINKRYSPAHYSVVTTRQPVSVRLSIFKTNRLIKRLHIMRNN